jgi:hypothetical protein
MQRHNKTRDSKDAIAEKAAKPSFFKRAKRSAAKLRDFALGLLNPGIGKKGADPTVVDPLIIKAQIPRSHFTRKGPGVEKQALRIFARFTGAQQHYACSRGWFPEWMTPEVTKEKGKKTKFFKIITPRGVR